MHPHEYPSCSVGQPRVTSGPVGPSVPGHLRALSVQITPRLRFCFSTGRHTGPPTLLWSHQEAYHIWTNDWVLLRYLPTPPRNPPVLRTVLTRHPRRRAIPRGPHCERDPIQQLPLRCQPSNAALSLFRPTYSGKSCCNKCCTSPSPPSKPTASMATRRVIHTICRPPHHQPDQPTNRPIAQPKSSKAQRGQPGRTASSKTTCAPACHMGCTGMGMTDDKLARYLVNPLLVLRSGDVLDQRPLVVVHQCRKCAHACMRGLAVQTAGVVGGRRRATLIGGMAGDLTSAVPAGALLVLRRLAPVAAPPRRRADLRGCRALG